MKAAIRAWCLYDVGHSAFATTIMAAVLPIYFSQVAGADLDVDPQKARALATSHWGLANTWIMLLSAILAPILGAVADAAGGRKRLLGFFALVGGIATLALFFVQRGDWLAALIIFGIGRLGFASSLVMYDSLLPHIAGARDIHRISARGYAWGYLGGGLLLAIQLAAITFPTRFGLPDAAMASRLAFVSAGVWWLLFTIPLLRHAPLERGDPRLQDASWISIASNAFARLMQTARELRRHGEAFKFLVAFWLYNDGIGTIVIMASIFGVEIGLGQGTLIGALLMVQILGFPFSLGFGHLAGRLGPQKSILVGLGGYILICLLGYGMRTGWHFWLLAFGVSLFQGGTQAISRSFFAQMIPEGRSSEFFGFYNVSSRIASITGPLLFVTAGRLLGNNRHGMLVLILLFVLGGILLMRVNPARKAN